MLKKVVNTDKAPAPVGPYSQSISLGDIIYCSGQIPLDASTGKLVAGSIVEQTHKVMENIAAVLEANNLNFDNIIKTTIFLSDMDSFADMNKVYAEYFKKDPPARSCVEVSRLPKDADIEIEVLACKS